MSELPVCPGCDEVIGHGELQHRGVCKYKGDTWHNACAFEDRGLDAKGWVTLPDPLRHNACAFEDRGLDKAETARRCPHCYAHSRWLPDETGPTTKRLCHGCGRVFDGPHAPVNTEAEP